jgi:pilus assembly protein CpaD
MSRSHRTLIATPGAVHVAARALAVVAIAAALGGCYTVRDNVAVAPIPSDYRDRHPIVVQERARTVELFIGSKRGELLPAQRATVLAFARDWSREATGGVIIQVPSGTPNERPAHDAVRETRSILVAAGVPDHGINVRPYRPADPNRFATLKLGYPRVAAAAGPCGLWPQDLGPSNLQDHAENHEYWNFGCAQQRNLAAMVENPADLVQPRGETPAYTGRRTTALEKYRKGEYPGTTYPNESKGKISDIGQ